MNVWKMKMPLKLQICKRYKKVTSLPLSAFGLESLAWEGTSDRRLKMANAELTTAWLWDDHFCVRTTAVYTGTYAAPSHCIYLLPGIWHTCCTIIRLLRLYKAFRLAGGFRRRLSPLTRKNTSTRVTKSYLSALGTSKEEYTHIIEQNANEANGEVHDLRWKLSTCKCQETCQQLHAPG